MDYGAELTRYTPAMHRAWAVRPGDRILDVGCGTGETTHAAARLAGDGEAVGVDIAAAALDRAAPGRNVTFHHGDAQTYPFPPAHFDLVISRFGTMFFDDPVAAFTNIGRALRPGGRLAMLVWQAREHNEWDVTIRAALDAPPAGRPDPFSLADPVVVDDVLHAAGFTGVDLKDVHEPVYYGPDVTAALAWVQRFTCTNEALRRLDQPAAERALDRLRQLFEEHRHADGIWFDARAWMVTAARG